MSVAIVAGDRFATETITRGPRRAASNRLVPWVTYLRCPQTGQRLELDDDGQTLRGTTVCYPVRRGVPLLLEGDALRRAMDWSPPARRPLRRRIWSLIPSPVSGARQKRYLRQFLARRAPGELVLNIGSAGWHLGPEVINVDLLPFAGVDLCTDIHGLPFADGEVDAIMCTGVLEHIADPAAAVAEFHRVLRPGGSVFCTVPFLQGYHEDPVDYRRYTGAGLGQLFADFSNHNIRPSHGAGSALAWIGADALAAALACNLNTLHTAWLMLLRCGLAPLRLLDRLSEGSRFEHIACSALLIEADR
ncbi:MAG: methyltransferase domain-containing protein [bacterium]|nr:methyltransferase domain-containing protein [bacterium]